MRAIVALTSLCIVACAEAGPDPEAALESEPSNPSGSFDEPWESTVSLALTPTQRGGRQLFNVFCWSCHGSSGRGDGPVVGSGAVPPNFMLDEYAGLSAGDFQKRLRRGEDGGAGASDHMQFVRSIVETDKFDEALSYLPALIYPAAIPGSALGGREIYARRCQPCHGATGAGDGEIGRALSINKPADFTRDTLVAQQDWEGLMGRIREGGQGPHTAMPPFGTFFSEGELWDLVAFLGTLQPGVLPSLSEETGG